jgi:hypothetical protein
VTDSTLNPIVGIVVTTSPIWILPLALHLPWVFGVCELRTLSLYSSVVFPALSYKVRRSVSLSHPIPLLNCPPRHLAEHLPVPKSKSGSLSSTTASPTAMIHLRPSCFFFKLFPLPCLFFPNLSFPRPPEQLDLAVSYPSLTRVLSFYLVWKPSS